MKKFAVLLIGSCVFQLLSFGFLYAKESDLLRLYKELKQLDLDENRTAEVENVYIRRDVADFNLEKGKIYFLKPILLAGEEHVTGAIFMGEGTFTFLPPTQIEKEQLARFYKEETLTREFSVMYLRFADTTFKELEGQLTFVQVPIAPDVKREKDYCEKYITERGNEDIIHLILNDLVSRTEDRFFYAYICKEKSSEGLCKPLFFIYNPYDVEEVRLEDRLTTVNYIRQTINQFHKQEDYINETNLSDENKDVIIPHHYQIETKIESDGDFSAKTNIEFDVVGEEVSILNFLISPKLKIDRIIDEDTNQISFIKEDDSAELILFFDEPLTKGCRKIVSMEYKGDILDRVYGGFYIKSTSFWYPRYDWRIRTSFDLTFKTPKQYKFICIGTCIEDRVEDKYRVTRWVQDIPSVNASFNLGPFKTYDIDVDGIPPITVFMSEEGDREIGQFLIEQGITTGKNMEKQVGSDVANSIQLFQHLFGTYPFKKIYVTEVQGGCGMSFPGLLHLSWYTFQRTDDWGYSEIFRAHEVAHQWWGITVGYKTYHDKWLSEGFAQYAGLWYMQWILKDNKRFFDILSEWRDGIFSNRKYLLGSGVEAGPVWLGPRTSTSETEEDYEIIVYKKGAYVLHMLRCMFIDLKTMNEDRFINMLHDFFNEYKGRDASIEDFKKTVEKHIGMDMDWFFEQWIYNTYLPTYRFSYNVLEESGGKYTISCRVEQENVPDDFRMYVPITIECEGDNIVRLKTLIEGPVTEFSIPPLPFKPKKLIFNDFNAVLAKVKYD